jgi:hypothetical protein
MVWYSTCLYRKPYVVQLTRCPLDELQVHGLRMQMLGDVMTTRSGQDQNKKKTENSISMICQCSRLQALIDEPPIEAELGRHTVHPHPTISSIQRHPLRQEHHDAASAVSVRLRTSSSGVLYDWVSFLFGSSRCCLACSNRAIVTPLP